VPRLATKICRCRTFLIIHYFSRFSKAVVHEIEMRKTTGKGSGRGRWAIQAISGRCTNCQGIGDFWHGELPLIDAAFLTGPSSQFVLFQLTADDRGNSPAGHGPAIERRVAAFGPERPLVDRPFHLGVDDRDIGWAAGLQRASVDA
jgi:hypothetical protein